MRSIAKNLLLASSFTCSLLSISSVTANDRMNRLRIGGESFHRSYRANFDERQHIDRRSLGATQARSSKQLNGAFISFESMASDAVYFSYDLGMSFANGSYNADGDLKVGYTFGVDSVFSLTPYLGTQSRVWRHKHVSSSHAAFRDNQFSQDQVSIGLKTHYRIGHELLLSANFQALHSYESKHYYYRPGEGRAGVDLKNSWSYHVDLNGDYAVSSTWGITGGAFYHHTNLGGHGYTRLSQNVERSAHKSRFYDIGGKFGLYFNIF